VAPPERPHKKPNLDIGKEKYEPTARDKTAPEALLCMGLFFKKLNTPPPFWQNEAKFTNDFKDRAADL
jgi:hypothetical protein